MTDIISKKKVLDTLCEVGRTEEEEQILLKVWDVIKGMTEWISVEDRLPNLHDESFETDDEIIYYEISDPVLVVYNYNDQIVAMYEKDKDEDEDGNYVFEGWMANGDNLHSVTHWMPLPQLPKEVSP